MQRILVAGAGHGGLVAAAKLAKQGFDVTVIEKEARAALGHDWEDRFTFSLMNDLLGIRECDFPAGSWRVRGDCAFISPAKRKRVEIFYDEAQAQRVMWRKPLIGMLLDAAQTAGVKFRFETPVLGPITEGTRVTGLRTQAGDLEAALVIDAAGVFSPVRMSLPAACEIEQSPQRGDLFYAWRGYFNKTVETMPRCPFEVSLYHEGEQGLSWCCTNPDSVDLLIGRIDPLTDEKVRVQIGNYKKDHPWIGDQLLHGGQYGLIPVRRPLTLLVADGYAAVGDSAFMTTPMNGMGIDLSMQAGALLAETVAANAGQPMTAAVLWTYNRRYHIEYGAAASKNAGLKNALLSLPSAGVDFLFEQSVIQAADLAGAGKNMQLGALLGKFVRGMKNPPWFFAVLRGLIKGGKAAGFYAAPPQDFDRAAIRAWDAKIRACDLEIAGPEA
ncbi:MAG: FAD-dependent monooxygenase [Clostridia bacterium]|nr:FAD-dependent monooxygenase [Clostridia bacterium]